MLLKIIGLCWMICPVLIFFVPNNNTGELLPYAAISFILGFICFKAAPKKQKKLPRSTSVDEKLDVSEKEIKIEFDRASNNRDSTARTSDSYGAKFENENPEDYKPKESKPIKNIQVDESNNSNKILESIPSEYKYVEYNLHFKDINNSYPMVKIPFCKSIVRTHRYGRINRRGFKEETFQKLMEKYFNNYFEISGLVILNTGSNTRPYEPDIALIGYSKINIRIDVEIDEPYAGITRKPTHCIGEDIQRDNYFKDRGWIVLRFSEYQVHKQPRECLNIIYRLIKKIDKSIFIEDLEQCNGIQRETSWTILKAQEWERENFRENYLDHQFQVLNEDNPNYDRNLNSQELNEEGLVQTSYTGEEDEGLMLGFNKRNYHPRDPSVIFYPIEHLYKVNGIEFQSVSTLVSKFFPEFNALRAAQNLNPDHPLYRMKVNEIIEYWKEKGRIASSKGTLLHLQIEKYFLEQEYEKTEEFHHFESFIEDHLDIKPYRSEWRIFDSEYNVAGTIDLIVEDEDEFSIYDWKRSKNIINVDGEINTNSWNQGIGILNHFDDTRFNRYCLQQSIYKYILENNYGLSIRNMYLIVLYPDYQEYYKVEVPYFEDEVKSILNSL